MSRLRLAGLVLLAASLACAGGGGSGAPAPGSLTVTITTPAAPYTPSGPAQVAASVRVASSGGAYVRVLTATTTLTDLSPGVYTVTAAPVRSSAGLVDGVYDGAVSGSPVTVASGATAAVSATYAPRPGSGRLWVVDDARQELQAYGPLQLGASGSPAPDVAVGVGAGGQAYGMAFSAAGELWVSEPGLSRLARYDPGQLASSGSRDPAATLGVRGVWLAFDGQGNLWVDRPGGSLDAYPAALLAGTGNLSVGPVATWSIPATGSVDSKLALDRAGNLWVFAEGDCASHAAVIYRRDALGLALSPPSPGAPLAYAARITSSRVFWVQAASFDADGDLWLTVLNGGSCLGGATLVRYRASQLAVTGDQAIDPEAVITVSGLASLGALAFDGAGDLWVLDYASGRLGRLRRSTIVASGSFTAAPDVVVTTPAASTPLLTSLAFDPAPAGLGFAQP